METPPQLSSFKAEQFENP